MRYDPYLALDRLTRHMRDAFLRLDDKLRYHREHKNNPMIIRIKGRAARLERTYAFEKGRIMSKINRLENPEPVFRKKQRNRR